MTSILERTSAPAEKASEETTLVFDNAEYAFRNADDTVVEAALSSSLPDDFVHDYRDALSAAAISLMPPLLKKAWARRNCTVKFVPRSVMRSSEVKRVFPNKTYYAVWDEAVSSLPDGTKLVEVALLNDELNGYREADHDRDDV